MRSQKPPPRRRTRGILLRALFGLAALGFLLSRLDLGEVAAGLTDLAWSGLLVALLAQSVGKVVWAERWREILRINGVQRSIGNLIALLMIGLFFNSFLPTSMGGDLVRGFYASDSGGRDRSRSYGVVIVERVLGLITLSLLVCISALAMFTWRNPPLPRELLITLGLLGMVMTLGGVLAFAWKGWRQWLAAWTRSRPRLATIVTDLGTGFDLFDQAGVRRVWILLTSFGVQLIGVVFFYGCALAVRMDVSFLVLCLVVPAAVLASMLPVSINGLGLREGALVGLLVAYGIPAALAGSFAFLALIINTLVALLGGVVYLFYRRPSRESPPTRAET